MDYRSYLMQMIQNGRVMKFGGTLRIINHNNKRTFSGSTSSPNINYNGTIKKLILDRLDNKIEPLTASFSNLKIGKKKSKKASKKASKRASKRASKKGKGVAKKKISFKPLKFKI